MASQVLPLGEQALITVYGMTADSSARIDRQVRWLADMGDHEGRQGYRLLFHFQRRS